MEILPGSRIKEDEEKIKHDLLHQINPQKLPPIENFKNWIQLGNKIYETDILLKGEEYYLLYKHPVHDYLDKLFLTEQKDLIQFYERKNYSR
ncbi:hypothetical protein L5D93_13295 [Paenibacillus thiaminolyticus]|nr:hypothetical protein [Paenibacillus thiaminolyticus]